jgi:hypothetical protein
MKAREEMPLLRCALGPTGRPFGDGLHSATASGTDGRKAIITRNWDMAGSTLKKPIRGRRMGVGAANPERAVALGAEVVRLAGGVVFATVGALEVGHEIHVPNFAHALGQAQACGYRLRRRKKRCG